MHWFFVFCLLLSLFGCTSQNNEQQTKNWNQIAARDNGQSALRPLIYRGITPDYWEIKPSENSVADTMKAICEFCITESTGAVRITIHTFPISESHPRIPAAAQIHRWKEQFDELNILQTFVSSESHGGFSGLYFEGQGSIQQKDIKVLGWSMQLAPEYERSLSLLLNPLDQYKLSDYTIKVTGPPELVDKYSQDIKCFANSFELIDELPKPL